MPTKIKYNGTEIATVAAGELKILECAGKNMLTNVMVEVEGDSEDLSAVLSEQEALILELKSTLEEKAVGNGAPTEVSTEADMTALLTSGEVGSVYKYTGESTDTYENGALYVLERDASNPIFVKLIDQTDLEEITITENGEYNGEYSKVTVEVPKPQLSAPTISRTTNILTITPNVDDGAFATSYDLYADGSLVGNYTSTTIDLTTLGLAAGIYSITIRAKGTNFVDSEESNVVSYIVAAADCLTFSSPSSFTLSVNNNAKSWDGTLEYSYDKDTWSEWDGTTTISADSGILYMRGTGNAIITGETNYTWILTGSDISCVGNIENLLDYATVANGEHPKMAEYCFFYLFYGCTSLTTAPELPATTLVDYCYFNMFCGCTSLATAPELPATTLAADCYEGMFQCCTSLTAAPELPATTLADYCYCGMFFDCTGLTTVPELPATTLAVGCYNGMFYGCTSLTTTPELPVTTLVDYCYCGMFSGCTGLTTVPELPATTLAYGCYLTMFDGCTGLKFSTEQTDEYTTAYRIPTSGTGIMATDALTNMFVNTGGTFTGTPEINTIYYYILDNGGGGEVTPEDIEKVIAEKYSEVLPTMTGSTLNLV